MAQKALAPGANIAVVTSRATAILRKLPIRSFDLSITEKGGWLSYPSSHSNRPSSRARPTSELPIKRNGLAATIFRCIPSQIRNRFQQKLALCLTWKIQPEGVDQVVLAQCNGNPPL
jgi:hypothetical protein